MIEMTCDQIEELAAEYALNILSASETKAVSAHILSCPACRLAIEEIEEIGNVLLECVPEIEPPSDLEDQLVAKLDHRHRISKIRVLTAAVAASLLIIAGVVIVSGLDKKPTAPAQLAGVLHQGAHQVGTVSIDANPAWVTMTINDLNYTGPVTCQVVSKSGAISTLGTFELTNGRGSWDTSDSLKISSLVAARVISPGGAVLATATLGDK